MGFCFCAFLCCVVVVVVCIFDLLAYIRAQIRAITQTAQRMHEHTKPPQHTQAPHKFIEITDIKYVYDWRAIRTDSTPAPKPLWTCVFRYSAYQKKLQLQRSESFSGNREDCRRRLYNTYSYIHTHKQTNTTKKKRPLQSARALTDLLRAVRENSTHRLKCRFCYTRSAYRLYVFLWLLFFVCLLRVCDSAACQSVRMTCKLLI